MKFVACYTHFWKGEKGQAKQRRNEMDQWLKRNRIKPASVRWYVDKATAKRPSKLEELNAAIVDGKVRAVVLWHLDRLSLSMRDRLNLLVDWCERSVRIVSVRQEIDIKPGDCKLIGSVLRGVKEFDSETTGVLTKAGLAAARASGRVGGRPTIAADNPKVVKAKQLYEDGKLSAEKICKRLKISRSTYYRYLDL